jgi:hypothetical protein
MKRSILLKSSFAIALISTIIGSLIKIVHWSNADVLLLIGLVASFIFIVTAIIDVQRSRRIASSEKTMWTIAFIFLGWIAGAVYLLFARKRIINA